MVPEQKLISKLPDAPGIYLFYNSKKELIYAGKATSLKNRVKSYFQGKRTPRPIEEMIHEVSDIKFKETNSVLEAVILEALYIKKFLPRYNVLGKDDKSWNYLALTDELFPRLVSMRQHELQTRNQENKKSRKQFAKIFGPYPGLNTKETMKILRKLFRFSTCQENKKSKNQKIKRPCLYYEMGQCFGVCVGAITAREYRAQVIRPLSLFLSGKTAAVIKYFTTQMRAASKAEDFEAAGRLRDQLRQLQRIQDMALLNKSFFDMTTDYRLQTTARDAVDRSLSAVVRIEGYDISNLGATEKVGSMVVFDSRGPVKNQYRKFIIKTVAGQSDVDSLAEVLTRRLKHSEWPSPDLLLIDGGRPQVSAVCKVLKVHKVLKVRQIPVIGIAKGRERKRNDIILGPNTRPLLLWLESHRSLLIQVRDEAHRFAITFHRQRRSRMV